MTERKVLNKYFPPEYDPSKIPRLRRGDRRKQFNIRTMAPFNMRCTTCNGYIYKAKKFNSRMETAENVDYLGLRHYRFYIRCPSCCSEIIWRTDLESGDYVLESGAKRNFEALKTAEELEAKKQAEEEEELRNNPMKMLEKRTDQSKQEMEMVEVIEDLKQLNQRQATMEADHILLRRMWQEEESVREAEIQADEALLKELLASQSEKIVPLVENTDNVPNTDSQKIPSTGKKLLSQSKGCVINPHNSKSYMKRQFKDIVLIPKSSSSSSFGNKLSSADDSDKNGELNEPPNKKQFNLMNHHNSVTTATTAVDNTTSKSSLPVLPGMVYSDDDSDNND